jgi:hypothetical protein
MNVYGGVTANFFRVCLTATFLGGVPTAVQAKWMTIHNDFEMYDLSGNAIATRSGCLRKFSDGYYWYGSASGFTNQTCYSSTDLWHWTYRGVAIAAAGTNRMDVVYNDSTKQYVMFLKTQNGTNCDLGIATSSTPVGPYTLRGNYKVFGYQIGDMSVYQDFDKKAYLCYVWDSVPGANSGGISEHGFGLLSPDYLSLSQREMLWHRGSREAPMMMKRHGIYYYLTSRTLWTTSTETIYYTATAIAGPWTNNLLDTMICPGNTAKNSWDTQCDFVFVFPGTQDTTYMYCGDRWEKPDPARVGDYAWLPITFSPKDSVIVNYYQDWEVEPDLGIWRPIDSKRNLALHKTATASSTSGTNVPNNVTDSTTWQNYRNTRWTSAASDPQWISIDLGSPMSVNRVIIKWDSAYAKAFQIQLSTDNSTWTTVYSTTNAGMRCVTDETFAAATARYVRMYGTTRGNTAAGYSMFELMVLNDPVTATTYKPGKSSVPSEALLTCRNSTIHYSIPKGSLVKLDVVDYSGKRVAVLVDGFKQAGDHEAVLPAALAHGRYIIRLTTGASTLATMQVTL